MHTRQQLRGNHLFAGMDAVVAVYMCVMRPSLSLSLVCAGMPSGFQQEQRPPQQASTFLEWSVCFRKFNKYTCKYYTPTMPTRTNRRAVARETLSSTIAHRERMLGFESRRLRACKHPHRAHTFEMRMIHVTYIHIRFRLQCCIIP